MTQIRDYAIERLASTIYDDDLIDIQIMEAGADQYEEARMKVSELRKLMNDGVTPKRYKALLSQNAPVASTVNVNMIAGQIWTLEIYSALDFTDPFNGLELISGTIRVAGSKYRSNTDLSFTFTTTEMSYDGSIYIVSTDANGDFNPFVKTTGVEPSFTYNSSGDNIATFTGLFANKSKVSHSTQNTTVGGEVNTSIITDDDMGIVTLDNTGTPADDILNYTPFEIEVYP